MWQETLQCENIPVISHISVVRISMIRTTLYTISSAHGELITDSKYFLQKGMQIIKKARDFHKEIPYFYIDTLGNIVLFADFV